jgi:hypothetical protein
MSISNQRTDQENLERLEGLFVGQLDAEEMELFERAIKLGCARRNYEGAGQLLGIAKVRLVYAPKGMP